MVQYDPDQDQLFRSDHGGFTPGTLVQIKLKSPDQIR